MDVTLAQNLYEVDPPIAAKDLTRFHVFWSLSDQDVLQKPEAIAEASTIIRTTSEPRGGISTDESGSEGDFCLRNIIIDTPRPYVSKPLFGEWQAREMNDPQTKSATEATVQQLINVNQSANLTEEQEEFGYKGSHRTLTHQYHHPRRFPLLRKVCNACHHDCCLESNDLSCPHRLSVEPRRGLLVRAADRSPSQAWAVRRSGRLCSCSCEADEIDLDSEFDTNMQQRNKKIALAEYSMSARIKGYMADNPDEPIVAEYQSHLDLRRRKVRPNTPRTWTQVRTEMRNKTLAESRVVGCTAFVANSLRDTIFIPSKRRRFDDGSRPVHSQTATSHHCRRYQLAAAFCQLG